MQSSAAGPASQGRGWGVIAMLCVHLGTATAHSGVAATQEPRLSLTAQSRLLLFATYRVPAEFESVGLSAALGKALSERSGHREWQAAIVVDNRIVTTTFTSGPSAPSGRVPSVIVVSGKGETQ